MAERIETIEGRRVGDLIVVIIDRPFRRSTMFHWWVLKPEMWEWVKHSDWLAIDRCSLDSEMTFTAWGAKRQAQRACRQIMDGRFDSGGKRQVWRFTREPEEAPPMTSPLPVLSEIEDEEA